jgi:hypothetical protein
LLACADFDAKREFLLGHIEKVIYDRYKVAITGFVPLQSASRATSLKFRIEDEIDIVAVRSKSQRIGRQQQKMALSPLAGRVSLLVAAE